jgi:hypothetical protein
VGKSDVQVPAIIAPGETEEKWLLMEKMFDLES